MKTILVDAVHCFVIDNGDTFCVFDDLYNLLESIRIAAVLLKPFIPQTSDKIFDQYTSSWRSYSG